MKNVLLLGDSICIGYNKSVKKSLENKANVIYTDENCRFASYLLRYFHEFFGEIKGEDIDVIHWNAGLWDCLHLFGEEAHTPLSVYEYYIDRLCSRMKKLCPNAKVIFATSTSVLTEKMGKDFRRYNDEIKEYNDAAVKIIEKYGFTTNDLYKLSISLPEETHSDPVHYYTPEGTERFTNQVLSFIAPALGMDEIPEYREEIHTDEPIGI